MKSVSWKKATAAGLGALVLAVGPMLGLTPDQCHWIATMLGTFIVGQGIADHGKSAAIIANGNGGH